MKLNTRIFSKHRKYTESKLTIQEAVDLIKEMELEKQHNTFENTNSTSNATEDDPNIEPNPDYALGDDEDI